MKILLLGGTGAIGSYLVDILAKNGQQVFVTTRQKRHNEENVTYLQGNAHDNQFLSHMCSEHWDAMVDFMSYKTEKFKERVEQLLSSTDHYVFISSSRIYSDKEHPIKETSPRLLDVSEDEDYLRTDEYALTKARQEDVLKGCRKRNYTIVRPYITYGDYRLQLGVLEKEEWLYRVLSNRTIVFSKEMFDKKTTLTNGYDVANGIYQIISTPTTLGETYHITNGDLLKWKDVFEIYSDVIKRIAGKQIKIKLVDNKDFLSCRHPSLIYQVIYDRLYDRDFDITKESQILDVSAFTPPNKGVEQCLSNFLIKPNFKSINWQYEANKDRITGEKTPLGEIEGFKNKVKYFIFRYLKS